MFIFYGRFLHTFYPCSRVGGLKGTGTFRDTMARLSGSIKPRMDVSWAVVTDGREYYMAADNHSSKAEWTTSICTATMLAKNLERLGSQRFSRTEGV